MKIYEYRIICPVNVDKYQIANMYMCAKKTFEESSAKKGEGIETIKDEPYTNDEESGQYSYKIMHFKSRIPKFIRWALPDKYCHVHEKSWSAFPHFHTVYSNPGLGEKFFVQIDSWHTTYKTGEPIPDNLLNLTPEELKIRKIVYLDVLDGKPDPSKERNLSKWSCPEINVNQPFSQYGDGKKHRSDESKVPSWTKNFQGDMMVAVKVVKVDFNWRAFQSMVEKYTTHTLAHDMFLDMHRDLLRWADQWCKMDLKAVKQYEKDLYSKTNQLGFEKDDDKPDEQLPDVKENEIAQHDES